MTAGEIATRQSVVLFTLAGLLAVACDDGAMPAPTRATAPSPTVARAAETLAFLRDGDVWLVDGGGGNGRQLGLSGVVSFSWVTATELAVVTGEDPPRHLLVSPEGNARELPFPAGGAWSRDGARYVMVVDEDIVLYDRNGSEVARREVEPPLEAGEKPRPCLGALAGGEPDRLLFSQPAFSPDGRGVVVAFDCASRHGAVGNLFAPLVVVDFEGSEPRSLGGLRINVGSLTSARFSPDGSHVAVADSSHVSACARAYGLLVVDPVDAVFAPITIEDVEAAREDPAATQQRGGVVGYDWSPDGSALLISVNLSFCRPDSPTIEPVAQGLYIVWLDGSEELLIDGPTHSPAWSPSGSSAAYLAQDFFGDAIGPPLLRLIDVETRQVTELGQGEHPAWQPER